MAFTSIFLKRPFLVRCSSAVSTGAIIADSVENVPGVLKSAGRPIINEFNGEPFHIAIARPTGSFEFTYGEIGRGTTTVTGDLEMAFEDSWALFCVHHYNQDGLVRSRSKLTDWIDA